MNSKQSNAQKTDYPGIFITFEGGEGVGKSTQIRLLEEKLRLRGFGVTNSREPGGTSGAEAIRHVLLEAGAAEPFGPGMEAVLFAAARNDHVEQVIRPALRRGNIVLIDRFLDSTRVYQGVSGALDPQFVSQLERVAIAGLSPDLTLVLDLPSREGLQRASIRRQPQEKADRFEKESIEVHEKRRQAFLQIAKAEPERVRVVDASGKPDEIAERIWSIVCEFLALKGLLPSKAHIPDDLMKPNLEKPDGAILRLTGMFSNRPKADR